MFRTLFPHQKNPGKLTFYSIVFEKPPRFGLVGFSKKSFVLLNSDHIPVGFLSYISNLTMIWYLPKKVVSIPRDMARRDEDMEAAGPVRWETGLYLGRRSGM